MPRPIVDRFPDIHPLAARLIGKTFCRDIAARFPTEETAAGDPTGFKELLDVLTVCRGALDQVRLDIGSWTTTGMVRSGNEDAFAVLHVVRARENSLQDSLLVFLADGMGGYEAGEVAAALAIRTLQESVLHEKAFAHFRSPGPGDAADQTMDSLDVGIYKLALASALQHANQAVYAAGRQANGQRRMGCTAEAVFAEG